tara:strand:- start:863 stop:1144 length:282 start_codon:yes stop_codon:yes gene_type:complete
MSVTAIASGIVTVAKAVPYIYKILEMVNEKMIDEKISKLNIQRITNRDKRNVILNQMQKASSNEERQILSVVHADYVYGRIPKLSDNDSETDI